MLQSLPCELPRVGTKSGGHIVDGQMKMGSFGQLILFQELETGTEATKHKFMLHIISTCRTIIRSQTSCACILTGSRRFTSTLLCRRDSSYSTVTMTYVLKASHLVPSTGQKLYSCDYYGITKAIYVIRIGIEEATWCTLQTNNNLQNVFTYDILSC